MNLTLIAQAIDKAGETVTLRRVTVGRHFVSVTTKARLVGYKPNELVGGIVQGDEMGIISDRDIALAQWPGPPRKGDQIIRDRSRTMTVQGCESRNGGTGVAMHVMQLRGT